MPSAVMDDGVMQDSGIEWIGAIPLGWRLDRLKDLVSLRDEKSTEKNEIEDYLELEDLEQETGRLLSVRNTLNVGSAVIKFYKGDVLFGKLRPYLRKYHLATFDGKCTGEILAFQPEKIVPKFLLYFIASDGFIKICTAMSYGAKMPRVNYPKQLALLPVCMPSEQEQQAIAHYLDQQCGKLDAVIAIKQQQIKTLDALRQSVIYQAVTKGLDATVPLIGSGVEWLGDIPLGWQVKSLKRLLEEPLKYGANEAAELEDRSLPRYIRITDFNHDGFLKEDSFKSLPFDKATGYYLKNGDVLFARSGATVGKTFIFYGEDKKACFAGYLIKASTNRYLVTPEFLYFYTKSPVYVVWISSIFTQATIQNIGADKYAYLPIIIPPLKEQQRIVDHLDQETQRLDTLKANLNQQISTLQAYKKSLIYECVTGKKRLAGYA